MENQCFRSPGGRKLSKTKGKLFLNEKDGFLKENLQFPLGRPTRAPPGQDRPDGAAGVAR